MYEDYGMDDVIRENQSDTLGKSLESTADHTEISKSSLELSEVQENPALLYGLTGDALPEGVTATEYKFENEGVERTSSRLIDTDGDGIYETEEIVHSGKRGPDTVLYRRDLDGDGMGEREEQIHFKMTLATNSETNRIEETVFADEKTIRVDSDGDGYFDVIQVSKNDAPKEKTGFANENFTPVTAMVRDDSASEWRALSDNPKTDEERRQLEIDQEKVNRAIYGETTQPDTPQYETLEYSAIDTDHDGVNDFLQYKIAETDENGNRIIDSVFSYDFDNDGIADMSMILRDLNNDGENDVGYWLTYNKETGDYDVEEMQDLPKVQVEPKTEEEPTPKEEPKPQETPEPQETPQPKETPKPQETPEKTDPHPQPEIPKETYPKHPKDHGLNSEDLTQFDPEKTDLSKVSGYPEKAIEYWECQGATNRCAIYAQRFVIEEITGVRPDIEDLCDYGEQQGWFTEEGGTKYRGLNQLLEVYGIENEAREGWTITEIEQALQNGDKVIVTVDADEYWHGENDSLYGPSDGTNHAVEVIGIDRSDPEHPMVILNDSGIRTGKGEMIPMDTFLGAWYDGNNYAIVAHHQ